MEDFDNLVLDPASPGHYEKRLLDASALATYERTGGTRASGPSFEEGRLVGGADGPDPVGNPDFVGEAGPGRRDRLQGLKALVLEAYREIALTSFARSGVPARSPGAPTRKRSSSSATARR